MQGAMAVSQDSSVCEDVSDANTEHIEAVRLRRKTLTVTDTESPAERKNQTRWQREGRLRLFFRKEKNYFVTAFISSFK